MKIALVILAASSVLVVTAIRLLGLGLGPDNKGDLPGSAMPRLLKGVLIFSVLAAIAIAVLLRWITGFLEGALS
ncbi:MAG: hypothetical protein ABIS18_05200 [Actinomycetota bacterium]